jgi:hypothetical protein
MQVGNCFVPRRGSGDNARYARVSCEETLNTGNVRCERIRGAMLYGTIVDPLSACCRCQCHAVGVACTLWRHWPALRDPRAPTRLIRHLDMSFTSMTVHTHTHASDQNLQFDTEPCQYTYLRMSSTGSHTIIVEIIVEYALGLRLSHIIRLTVTAHRFRASGLPPATISSLRYRPGADSSSASSQMCPRTRRGRE